MIVGPADLVAITGATGAIGKRIVEDLLSDGFHLRLLSRSAIAARAGVEVINIDLASDEPVPPEALAGCKAVVHLASHIPARQEDPEAAETCFRTNAMGTIRLLEAMEASGTRQLLQTTSANAYAPGLDAPCEDDLMYPDRRAPFYLSSKIAQDVFGSYWSRQRALCVTTLRLSSVYGAGMESSLFTRFARALRAGEDIQLANGGSFGADFVDVSDVSDAIRLFLKAPETGAFNIASGERTTLLQASRLLLEITGADEDRLAVARVESDEPGFPRIDIRKARKRGYSPHDLHWGLTRLVDSLD